MFPLGAILDIGSKLVDKFFPDPAQAEQAKKTNGVQLASCYGPINESPFTNGHIKPGSKIITDAPAGVLNPVGGNF